MKSIFSLNSSKFNNNINVCNEECLRNKKLIELQTAYNNAKNNLQSAPSVYQQSKKDFYVFKYGLNEYNKLLEQEYRKEANDRYLL
jgi:hypothetical protein